MKIALSTDHVGFEQLKKLQDYLQDLGYECINFGPDSYDQEDDYPDFIRPAAKAVANGEAEAGIILGGSGQGEAMTANHVKGVRCALYYGPATAQKAIDAEGTASSDPYDIIRLTREHNHANMLSIGVRFVSLDDMKKVITIWLETHHGNAERHARRAAKIDNPEY